MTVNPGEESLSKMNLVKPKAVLDIRKYVFSHRTVDQWNSLPDSVKKAKDVNNFKNLYDANCKLD